jgi:hypothetical protein
MLNPAKRMHAPSTNKKKTRKSVVIGTWYGGRSNCTATMEFNRIFLVGSRFNLKKV